MTACPSCGAKDRFWMVGQELSIEQRNLRVRVERVILHCRACKAAVAVERQGARIWHGIEAGQPGVAEANGAEAQPRGKRDDMSDSDLPRLFRK